MKKDKDYLLSDYDFLDQMHDERINEINIKGNELELVFDYLHFYHGDNYKHAKIIFNNLEDVKSDVYVRIFIENKCVIEKGYLMYIDDFIPYFKKENINLEITDIIKGYNLIIILGVFVGLNTYRDENFQLFVSTDRISYSFYD